VRVDSAEAEQARREAELRAELTRRGTRCDELGASLAETAARAAEYER
jgi:hypothetical protein